MIKKRILVTGKGSYIGTNFKKWLEQCSNEYEIDEISVKDIGWKEHSFSDYDVILHVAAIVHQKKSKYQKESYYDVNYKLPVEIANKAKKEGVKQFIFFSTMAVYGLDGKVGREVVIDEETKCNPQTEYARSKMMAENELVKLNTDNFKVVVIRPPMVYGENCKGNYQFIKKISKIPFFLFPDINNQRSMISIDNLCGFLKSIVDYENSGLFFPQDDKYVSTKDLLYQLAEMEGSSMKITKLLNPLIGFISIFDVKTVNKVFGNLVYAKSTLPKFELYSNSKLIKNTEVR